MQAEDYLYSLYDFEKEKSARRKSKPFTLERLKKALSHFDLNDFPAKIIHIAGTKGKGSTLLYIEHILREYVGIKKVGLFTSPHLKSIHERIQIDGKAIGDEKLLSLAKEIYLEAQEKIKEELTFFEMMLLIAMKYFKESGVTVILLETGLGGRLDATNAVHADLSILAKIGLDHCDMLGDTLELIASEKAGIVKKAPVLALKQKASVNHIFTQKCSLMNVPLEWVSADSSKESPPSKGENIALALKAVEILFGVNQTLPKFMQMLSIQLPGRLEYRCIEKQNYLLDSAHNEISFQNLKESLGNQNNNYEMCIALSEGREPSSLLRLFAFEKIDISLCYLPGDRPGVSVCDLQKEILQINQNVRIHLINNKTELQAWLKNKTSKLKVITGSFYLVGEVLKIFEGDS